jgi:hypothetical protein
MGEEEGAIRGGLSVSFAHNVYPVFCLMTQRPTRC